MNDTQHMSQGNDTLSAASPLEAAYLAADKIASSGGMGAAHAPVNGTKVNLSDMCAKMLAFTFLALWDENAVELALTDRKVLFVKTKQVTVHKKRENTQTAGAQPLLSAIQDGKSAHDAVYAWFGTDYENPWAFVVEIALRDAERHGLLVEDKSGGLKAKLGALLTGESRVHPVAEKQREVDAVADVCAQRWKQFEAEHSDLAQQLVKECSKAISGRKEASSSMPVDYSPPDF
ncbi:MAG: hypothetical protein ACYDHD_04985 [Vulcanimicrobiaceae bacterium]